MTKEQQRTWLEESGSLISDNKATVIKKYGTGTKTDTHFSWRPLFQNLQCFNEDYTLSTLAAPLSTQGCLLLLLSWVEAAVLGSHSFSWFIAMFC